MTGLVLGRSILLLAVTAGGSEAAATVISVYVSAGDPATGFVDPDSKDSAKDPAAASRTPAPTPLVV